VQRAVDNNVIENEYLNVPFLEDEVMKVLARNMQLGRVTT